MEFLYYTVLPLIAFALTLAAVAVGALALSGISARIEATERWLPVVLVAIAGILLTAGGVLNSKNLQFASLGANFIETAPSQAFVWLSRLGSLAVVSVCVPYFIAKLLLRKKETNSRVSLPVAIIVFFGISNFLLPGLFGQVASVDHRSFYPIILMLAVHSATQNGVDPALKTLKWFLVLFLAVSLLFIVIDSSRVLAPGYKGWIPGMSSRFWGLAPHANAIGPMAGLLIFLELLVSEKRVVLRLFVFAIAAAVLLLAQSKTAIGAVMLGLAIVAYCRLAPSQTSNEPRKLHWGHGAALIFGILGSGLLLVLSMTGIIDHTLSRLDGSEISNSVQTMSGRSAIWETAFREFLANPIFGYGPTLWDENYRRSVGLNFAYHAHNQVFQTLAEAGFVGFVGLLAFILITIVLCVRASQPTRGISVAILLLFLFRCVTEVPLHPTGIGNGEMFMMIALICLWRTGNDSKNQLFA